MKTICSINVSLTITYLTHVYSTKGLYDKRLFDKFPFDKCTVSAISVDKGLPWLNDELNTWRASPFLNQLIFMLASPSGTTLHSMCADWPSATTSVPVRGVTKTGLSKFCWSSETWRWAALERSSSVIFLMPSGCWESRRSEPLAKTLHEAVVTASPSEFVALHS